MSFEKIDDGLRSVVRLYSHIFYTRLSKKGHKNNPTTKESIGLTSDPAESQASQSLLNCRYRRLIMTKRHTNESIQLTG